MMKIDPVSETYFGQAMDKAHNINNQEHIGQVQSADNL
jgi:hypothetical protein